MNFLSQNPLGNLQQGGPYQGVGDFLNGYFFSGGIGFWLFFLLLAITAVAVISFETQRRNLSAPGLKVGAYIALLLLLPSLLFRFTVTEDQVYKYYDLENQIDNLEYYQPDNWRELVEPLYYTQDNAYPPLTGYLEPIIMLGVLGGLGGLSLAITFFIMYQGQGGGRSVVPQGPGSGYGGERTYAPPPPPAAVPPPSYGQSGRVSAPPSRPNKQRVNAWLVGQDGKNYQLYVGETIVGRSSRCDIQIIGDTTLSKRHAKLVERNGRFTLYDLGSTNGVKINGKRLRQPVLLSPNDQVQLGDNTYLKFVAS